MRSKKIFAKKTSVVGMGALVACVGCGSSGSAVSRVAPERSDSPASAAPPISATGRPVALAPFEEASIVVPVESTCLMQPVGNTDKRQIVPVHVDVDGVARFLAARPTSPSAVGRLSLDCTDGAGNAKTYPVDLRSDDTFVRRRFDPERAGLAVRPKLAGDPLGYTREELIQAGYGLRPDPTDNPDGYARWLAAASIPAHLLGRAPPRMPALATSTSTTKEVDGRIEKLPKLPASGTATRPAPSASPPSDPATSPEQPKAVDATVTASGSTPPWTGPILTGKYKRASTAAKTVSYVSSEATFNVPTITPGAYRTGVTRFSIWNGLDNWDNLTSPPTETLLQAGVQAYIASAGAAPYIVAFTECFSPSNIGNGVRFTNATFTPAQGDMVYAEEWYCDANGNVNLAGGYACAYMLDETQSIAWSCNLGNSTTCPSYKLNGPELSNGGLGQRAEFVVENQTAETQGITNYDWTPFSTITMSGSAAVVTGNGFHTAETTITPYTDPVVMLGTDFATNVPAHVNISIAKTGNVVWTQLQTPTALSGDFNGDGIDDLALVGGLASNLGIPLALSHGDGTFQSSNVGVSNASFIAWATGQGAQAVRGDFDGNGAADIALVGGAGWGSVPVAFASRPGPFTPGTFNVTNFSVPNFPAWASTPGAQPVVGDFNGDGLTDIALVGPSGWGSVPVAFSQGNGNFNVTNTALADFPGLASQAGVQAVGGDFDGDGFADIALVGGLNWSSFPVAFGGGDGSFLVTNYSESPSITVFPTPQHTFCGYAMQPGAKAVSGDFNSDGLTDIALVGGAGTLWSVLPIAFSNPFGGGGTFTVTTETDVFFTDWATQGGVQAVSGHFASGYGGGVALVGGPDVICPLCLTKGQNTIGVTATNYPTDNLGRFPFLSNKSVLPFETYALQ